jgi:hypothetical protein
LVWSNSQQKKKAREILYKAHWTELLVSPWKNYYAELITTFRNAFISIQILLIFKNLLLWNCLVKWTETG